MSVGNTMIEGAWNMLTGHQQNRNQRRLMSDQFGYNKKMAKYGHDLQMDMWNKTNYKAQVEHMKAAGLNPGLMYGSAGQGGSTGSQSAQGVSQGQAGMMHSMDIANMSLIKAQRDKLKEETENIKKDTELKGSQIGESGARTEDYKASAGYKTLQGDYQKILNMYKSTEIIAELGKIGQETRNLRQQYDLTKEQWTGLVMEAGGKGLSAMNQAENIAANTKLTRTEEKLAWEKMDVVYNELALKGLDTEARLTSADANMIRSRVEEALRPLELGQRKWEMWVNNITKIITQTIGSVGNVVSAGAKGLN